MTGSWTHKMDVYNLSKCIHVEQYKVNQNQQVVDFELLHVLYT